MKSKRIALLLLGTLMVLGTKAQVDESHVRLTNLPHVYINTFSGASITSKTTYVLAKMWMVDEKDSVAFYDSLEIRGRGNSTWSLAKKPYRLRFHQKEKLLGKGYAKTKKWTMLANHGDKTMIRNAVTSAVGERLGLKFNPAAKFVDLTLNDEYVGTYQISDAVDVRPHRVNIVEQDLPLTETSNITGGYLLEADGFNDFTNGKTGFYTNYTSAPIRIHYPDGDDIQDNQFRYIRDFINGFEQRLFSDDYADATEGYRAQVDSTSLANWYLATEISGNIDGFFSTYFYKEQDDDHIFWGPLWDYDIAYANDNRKGDTSQQLMRDVAFTNNIRSWIERMWTDEWFTTLVARRYHQAMKDGLDTYMLETIDSLTTLLDASQQLNYKRWGINQRTLRERVLYSTYDQYVSDLRSYVTAHTAYLSQVFDGLLPEESEEKIPDFEPDTTMYYSIANAGTGTVFDIQTSDNRLCANATNEDSESQQWLIRPLANGFMHIVNRMTGLALNDPTEGNPTATTLVGTQLNTAEADSTDTRQQWDIVKQNNTQYNLINRFSQHGANLSGGSSANGTAILSYTSNERDATSKNRLWTLTAVAERTDGIDTAEDATQDYALAYDPTNKRLHFGCDNPAELRFQVRLYNQAGQLLRTFRANDGCDLTDLPQAIYIVSWTTGKRTHSIKFLK